jgi:hypothetical protein
MLKFCKNAIKKYPEARNIKYDDVNFKLSVMRCGEHDGVADFEFVNPSWGLIEIRSNPEKQKLFYDIRGKFPSSDIVFTHIYRYNDMYDNALIPFTVSTSKKINKDVISCSNQLYEEYKKISKNPIDKSAFCKTLKEEYPKYSYSDSDKNMHICDKLIRFEKEKIGFCTTTKSYEKKHKGKFVKLE